MIRIAVLDPDKSLSHNFGDQITELIRIVGIIEENEDFFEKYEFDLSNLRFVRPLFLLGLYSIFNRLERSGNTFSIVNASNKYLDLVHFPYGLKSDEMRDIHGEMLRYYSNKSYLPILNFPADSSAASVELRDKTLSCLNSILSKTIRADANMKIVISYLISEMTDNISEHSMTDRGVIMAQYYPAHRYVDIAILDNGQTILGSYRNNGIFVENATDAINKAMQGYSTKSDERGYGISTSRAMIVEGLGGKFGLMSNRALFANYQAVELPVCWNGTFLILRVPEAKENFDFYKYARG